MGHLQQEKVVERGGVFLVQFADTVQGIQYPS